jgi:hypothetical protein
MNLLEERQKILDAFEKYPDKKGSRTDLNNKKVPYNRYKLISDELGGRWSTNGRLAMIKEILDNDTDTYFFTKGIVKHNWLIPSTYKIYKEGYYQLDKENDNVIVGKIDNDEIFPTTTDVINVIEKHYKVNRENLLYFIEVSDNGFIFPYRKIGVTNNITNRIKPIDTFLPFDVHPIALWSVEFGKKTKLETYLHKLLKDIHKKGEWFVDSDFDLLSKVREVINNIKDIHITELFINDRLKNVDNYSSVMNLVHTRFGPDADITVEGDLVNVKLENDRHFGVFGMF